VNAGLPVLHSL